MANMLLTLFEVNKIRKAYPILLEAQTFTGVPWQAVAAVWYRENSLEIVSPRTPGGPFQLDPVPSHDELVTLLDEFTRMDFYQKKAYLTLSPNTFEGGCVFAACILRRNCKSHLTVDSSYDDIKDALYGYNGRAYGSADASPYVMNFADAQHMNMVICGSIPDPQHPGRRIKIRTVDKRLGAFVVYRQLRSMKFP